MKRDFVISIVISAIISGMSPACRRDIDTNPDSPKHQIDKSEKLTIPEEIELPGKVPAGYTRVATYFAEGVQKYKAQQKPGSDPATFQWVFVSPQADLYNGTNKKVGVHSAGPSWKLFAGPDSILAQQFSPPKAAASPEAGSIDWLLLLPKSGTIPTGIFKNVAYIQRIATHGGKAPARLPVSATETVEIKYTAVYRFTKTN